MSEQGDIIVAEATPPGRAAISVVRLSGAGARELVESLSGYKLPAAGRSLAKIRDIDQALLLTFVAPRSFTGEDVVELHLHGNPSIVQDILAACIRAGARPAEPGEFSQRAYLNGKLDLAQAEAIMDTISASSATLQRAALGQMEGKLSEKVKGVVSRIDTISTHLFGPMDFPVETEAISIDMLWLGQELAQIRGDLQRMLDMAVPAAILRQGIKTLIAGQPNAGKSSLLNRLLGYDRALVSAEAGTTRDYLSERILLRDLPLILIDTAGLREQAGGELEQQGMDRAISLAQESDLLIYVYDAQVGWTASDKELLERLSVPKKLLVANKIDLLATGETPQGVPIAAATGQGFPELESAISETLALSSPNLEYAINRRQANCLTAALAAMDGLEGTTEDILVSRLREAQDSLLALLGRGSEDVSEGVFREFCIGK